MPGECECECECYGLIETGMNALWNSNLTEADIDARLGINLAETDTGVETDTDTDMDIDALCADFCDEDGSTHHTTFALLLHDAAQQQHPPVASWSAEFMEKTTPDMCLVLDPIHTVHACLKAGVMDIAEIFMRLLRQVNRERGIDDPVVPFLTTYLECSKCVRDGLEWLRICHEKPLECRLIAAEETMLHSLIATEQRRQACELLAVTHCMQLGRTGGTPIIVE
jgi:hypothetical protein